MTDQIAETGLETTRQGLGSRENDSPIDRNLKLGWGAGLYGKN